MINPSNTFQVNGVESVGSLVTPRPDPARARDNSTREIILSATRTALVREGYERITTRRIAEIAEVNVATLHYHFGNKEALLREAMHHALAQTQSRMREAIAGAHDLDSALTRAFDCIWTLLKERPGVLRFDLAVRGFRDPAARVEVQGVYSAYRSLIIEMIVQHCPKVEQSGHDQTAERIAHYMMCAVDGTVLQHTITGDDASAMSALTMIREHVQTLLERA